MGIIELEATAYHEAGHAVACYELGRGFQYVTIIPRMEDNSLGHIMYTRWQLQFDEYAPLTPRLQHVLEHDIVIAMAGPFAEERLTGKYNEGGAGGDHESATDASLFINGGDPEGASLHWTWLSYKAKHIFDHPARWIAVQALAAELLKCQTVSARRARKIIRQAFQDACKTREQRGKWIDLNGEEIPDMLEQVEGISSKMDAL